MSISSYCVIGNAILSGRDVRRVWELANLGGEFDTAVPWGWMAARIARQKETGNRGLSPVGHVWWYPDAHRSPAKHQCCHIFGRPLRWAAVVKIARQNLARLRKEAGLEVSEPLGADACEMLGLMAA